MRRAAYAAFRWAFRFLDARLPGWLSPHRAAVARLTAAWAGHLLFPGTIAEPDSRLLADVHRLGRGGAALPDWARAEMKEQSEFEPLLFPSAERLTRLYFFRIPHEFEAPGRAFGRLHAAAGREPIDHILFVPWLRVGGADRAALAHSEAMVSFGKRVLVVTTEPGDSPWAQRLPAGVRFLAAGEELAAIDPVSRGHVLARLVLQRKPESMHVINSIEAWKTVRHYGRALCDVTRIYASAFCDDITPEGELISAARLHARDCAPYLSALLTDCRYYANVLKRDTGIAGEKVHVVYLPVDPPEGPLWEPPTGPPTVLWAGRLDRQKRPDILAAIAERLPEFTFEVYGTQVLDTAQDMIARLAALPNVKLRGRYDGFDELPWRRCHVFLYTSQWDGLPNVLLEAAARGLPVVAPAVGGVPELPPQDNVVVVEEFDNVGAYAQALLAIVEFQLSRPQGPTYLRRKRGLADSWQTFAKFSHDVRALLA